MLPEIYFKPDIGIILTVSDKVREERQKNRGKAAETFEMRKQDFQTKVNAAYPKIAKDFGLELIDASGSIEEVFALILTKL